MEGSFQGSGRCRKKRLPLGKKPLRVALPIQRRRRIGGDTVGAIEPGSRRHRRIIMPQAKYRRQQNGVQRRVKRARWSDVLGATSRVAHSLFVDELRTQEAKRCDCGLHPRQVTGYSVAYAGTWMNEVAVIDERVEMP